MMTSDAFVMGVPRMSCPYSSTVCRSLAHCNLAWARSEEARGGPGLCLIRGGGVQGVPGAGTMAVAGDSQSGWGQLLAVGGAVACGGGGQAKA